MSYYVCMLQIGIEHFLTNEYQDMSSQKTKFGNFREHFIFANCVKRHISHVFNSQLRHEWPTTVNDRLISRGFYFHETLHMRSFAKIKPSGKISEFTVTVHEGVLDVYSSLNLGHEPRGPVLWYLVTPSPAPMLSMLPDKWLIKIWKT